ncbi:energy-coupling factor transporter ATPase [Alteribacillus sp. HJP-4]
MQAVRLQNIYFQYEDGGTWTLDNIEANIAPGEWVAVIGPNGSGKSTLSRLFNGLLLPQQGKVMIEGIDSAEKERLPEVRRKVGMVFQNPDHQFVAPTVQDDIAFGMENAGVPRETMKERISWAAEKTGVSTILDMEPHRLSGGQKQRVAIAGVLALQPGVMVFDEATAMLDPNGRKEVLATIEALHQEGVTIISVTHQLHEAMKADRIWYMENGRLELDVTSRHMLEHLDWLEYKSIPLPYTFKLYQELKRKGHPAEALDELVGRRSLS